MSPLIEVCDRIEKAMTLVRLAAFAYRRGDAIAAVIFEIAAIGECSNSFVAITVLTEPEADRIERRFTELEEEMQALPKWIFANNKNGFALCARN
jgi:hypothetical protein